MMLMLMLVLMLIMLTMLMLSNPPDLGMLISSTVKNVLSFTLKSRSALAPFCGWRWRTLKLDVRRGF